MDDNIIFNEINETYNAKKIERTKKELKEIDEKDNKIFYESLKVGMMSGISTYGIIKMIQKFTK
jgi:hypothetical protein